MLRKNQRLSQEEFKKVFKEGKFSSGDFLKARWMVSREKKIAVVVPKSIFKNQVSRNKLRRRIYDFIREVGVRQPSVKIIIFSTQIFSEKSPAEQKILLQRFLERVARG